AVFIPFIYPKGLLVVFFLSITVNTPAELHASKGDTMSVDWSYRPQTGGPPQTFFHFSSRAFPPTAGQFNGRIKWQGSPARDDASISLINATLNDNGTYTCSVRNPPDVHGAPTSHSVLTVTPKGTVHTQSLKLCVSTLNQSAEDNCLSCMYRAWQVCIRVVTITRYLYRNTQRRRNALSRKLIFRSD
uniref:Ig-like domain-containing protein n=1 Tax=Neogobius melanostomus TaxID=47308 RepID=A0A8C6TM97_9GOBI